MGKALSIASRMGETNNYRELTPAGSFLTIHFYGLEPFNTRPLSVPLDSPITCEEVLILCAKHLSENLGRYFSRDSEKSIGPLHLSLFGLCMKELYQCPKPKDLFSLLWIAEGHIFSSSHAEQEMYFRMRVRPPGSKTLTDKIPPGVCADYLFWQCAEDVLSGRVWMLFSSENRIKSIDAINFNALHIIMASAQYRLHDVVACDPTRVLNTPLKDLTKVQHVLDKVTFFNIHHHIPKKMTPELKRDYDLKDPSMRYMSRCYLRKYIKQFFNQNGDRSIRNLRLMFVDKLIREDVLNYGLEFFGAKRIENPAPVPVELIIRPFQGGGTPGLYFNKKLASQLRDILGVEIRDSENSHSEQMTVVSMEFRHQPPLILHMASPQLAESFISEVEAFYRLKVNYHSSLLDDHNRGPSFLVLSLLRSYGPMQEEGARQHFRQQRKESRQSPDNPQYMIYQDCMAFGLLHVLGTTIGTNSLTEYNIRFKLVDGGFSFSVHVPGRSEALFTSSEKRQLLMYLHSELMLGQQIVPKEKDVCEPMSFLKDDDPYYIYSEILEEPVPRKRRGEMSDPPLMYRQEQIGISSDPIGKGKFSEVYLVTQIEPERHAVLKKVTSTDRAVEEAYRMGAERLVKLREGSHLFVKIFGFIIHPQGVIMECMPLIRESTPRASCSLLERMTRPFNWFHVRSVLRQLASCLDYLSQSGLIYGSLCCSKILIFSEKSSEGDKEWLIRLADPSKAIYLDTLPVEDSRNRHRLAWIAPERFNNLKNHTFASEVYALGTTLWEIVAGGQRPDSCVPAGTSAVQFFCGTHILPTDFLGVTCSEAEVDQPSMSHREDRTGEWVAAHFQHMDDVDEYVRGAQCSDDSSTVRGQSGEGRPSGEEQGTGERITPLERVKKTLANLIHACRHQDPNLRPTATHILKKARALQKEVELVAYHDDHWIMNCLLQHSVERGHTSEQSAAELGQNLQANMQVQAANVQQSSREELKNWEMRFQGTMGHFIILGSRLRVPPTPIELGQGYFGKVQKAELMPECETQEEEGNCEWQTVAVKMIRETQEPSQLVSFLKEAWCICHLQHDNVVKLIGIVMRGQESDSFKLVMEYADGGSFEKYVDKHVNCLGTLKFKMTLKKLATDVAKGMEYVCQKQSRVHGDLAARNVLLFSVNGQGREPFLAKLCDFGQSHKLTRGYYDFRKSKSAGEPHLPAYLLPPELLRVWKDTQHADMKFSVYTDVWSYGIFLWEIFSNRRPESVLGTEPLKILEKYERHELPLTKPDYCPRKLYDIAMKCWAFSQEDRPMFDGLVQALSDLTEHDME